jgi:hypothetical protein
MYLFISIFDQPSGMFVVTESIQEFGKYCWPTSDGWCAILWAAEVDNKAKQAADDGGNDLNARHVAENGVSGRAQLVR